MVGATVVDMNVAIGLQVAHSMKSKKRLTMASETTTRQELLVSGLAQTDALAGVTKFGGLQKCMIKSKNAMPLPMITKENEPRYFWTGIAFTSA